MCCQAVTFEILRELCIVEEMTCIFHRVVIQNSFTFCENVFFSL